MKIHSIEADNFKLFTTNFHKIQDITNAEMILFNGPNGYGKTKSIYIHTSEDVEDIQFVNSPQDNQDILYSMSSGQLSAVALSFLLCMNQAYGAHKACSILLIDDPVQTIDDVNMVGLVDILRYGFGDRQIFISTHEQSFEWFLRYRYSKAGKNVKIFNMKDIMLQEE